MQNIRFNGRKETKYKKNQPHNNCSSSLSIFIWDYMTIVCWWLVVCVYVYINTISTSLSSIKDTVWAFYMLDICMSPAVGMIDSPKYIEFFSIMKSQIASRMCKSNVTDHSLGPTSLDEARVIWCTPYSDYLLKRGQGERHRTVSTRKSRQDRQMIMSLESRILRHHPSQR